MTTQEQKPMITRKTWEEFRAIGMLWWINTILHMFGWAIVVNVEKETGKISDVYPARVRFRGFSEKDLSEGYRKVTDFLKENILTLSEEANE